MKFFVAAAVATVSARDLLLKSSAPANYNSETACPAGTVANLLTSPRLCVSTQILTPATAAGINLAAASPTQGESETYVGSWLLAGLTGELVKLSRGFDNVAGVKTATLHVVNSYLMDVKGVNQNYTAFNQSVVDLMTAGYFTAGVKKNIGVAWAGAVCTAIKGLFTSGATCIPSTCRNVTFNICDGDNGTQGYDSVVAGYVTSLGGLAKVVCGTAGTGGQTMTTCDALFPAAAGFGTYVEPPTAASNSTNATKAPSSASIVEVGLLAAASVVVAVLAF
jgi:hypothetical protein